MSLFRKPKKRIQTRIFTVDEEDDQNGEEEAMEVDSGMPSAPPPLVIKEKKNKEKLKTKAILSFGDDEEEGEVFRVKKSSHSKKLQRQLDKERKRGLQPPLPPEWPKNVAVDASNGAGNKSQNIKDVTNSNNSRKNDSYVKPNPEGLILSGRAALVAVATGDLSESGSEAEEEIGGGFHSFRPSRDTVRAMLDKGVIPDAALIHAARKTRQKARDLRGAGADFLSLHSGAGPEQVSEQNNTDTGSRGTRLVREDGDGDGSDEEAERIQVRGVIVEDRPAPNKRKPLKPAQDDNSGSERDSANEEWESQQIRKAVTGAQLAAATQNSMEDDMMLNPFTMCVPGEVALRPNPGTAPLLLPTLPGQPARAPNNVAELTACLRDRLTFLRSSRDTTAEELSSHMLRLAQSCEKVVVSTAAVSRLDARYRFYQQLRGFLTDLIECLDEKIPIIDKLEERALTLASRRATFIQERRRADVRDQARDVLALTAKPGTVRAPDSEEKVRRAAEREGRRLRRRRAREAAAGVTVMPAITTHRDGDSSDDELPHTEVQACHTAAESISLEARALFSDTLPSFSCVRGAAARLCAWRRREPTAYNDAYVARCLPRLLAPYLRKEMLLWNPILDADAKPIEQMDWYKYLCMYGAKGYRIKSSGSSGDESNGSGSASETEELSEGEGEYSAIGEDREEVLAEDADLMLVPDLVLNVVVPKVTELCKVCWEPSSESQTRRLVTLVRNLSSWPGAKSATLKPLAQSILERITQALNNDLYIPILPTVLIEGRGASVFNRSVGFAARLLRVVCYLHSTLSDEVLRPLLEKQLIERYILLAARCCNPVQGADICWLAGCCVPRAWHPLPRLRVQAEQIRAKLHPDNPLHLKALDQIKRILSMDAPKLS